MWHESTQSVLIDTDIGDDIDDAFGLALALRLPQLRVRGVTTVAGPVQGRARLAQRILAAAGCPDVPVAPGSSVMSDGRPGSGRFSQQPLVGIEHAESKTKHAAMDASQFSMLNSQLSTDLIMACSQGASPLTIIALGPLTNIAAVLARDPTLARRARLVAMAGKLGYPYPDWNLRCDPAAARRVLGSGMPITLVGMHVTMSAKMRASQLRRMFAGRDPLGVVLARCVLAWRTWKRRIPILHDALTVAVAADPTLARLAPRRVVVGWRGFSLAGRFTTPNALVCTGVDPSQFHKLLETYLLGGAQAEQRCGPWCRLLRARACAQ
jgi:inosine-uridine nucleoside N-ribohydrolase